MNIQLVGITSLYIAAKIEEQKPRQIRDYAETTERSCTENEIKDMEKNILIVLNWKLIPP